MEWWKLFSGTFVLIFLAELGDKTQLAAMAKTADSPDSGMAKWVVFLAASLALATSTFIAVFLGQALKSIVPDERYIKLAAAVLFLVFGFMILFETVRSFRADHAPAAAPVAVKAPAAMEKAAGQKHGLAGGLALRAAMDFEALAMTRYQKLAKDAPPELCELLTQLAKEEEGHLRRLRALPDEQVCQLALKDTETGTGTTGRHPVGDLKGNELIVALIQQEEATAAFYGDLAKRTLIPSVRSVLAALAEEERSHAQRLREVT